MFTGARIKTCNDNSAIFGKNQNGMKIIFFILLLAAMGNQLNAQDTVNANTAAKYAGKKVVVCDKVYGGRWLENAKGEPTLINMGNAYPNNPFTFVIFGEDRQKFDYKPEEWLVDKNVCVSGEISLYKDKPQIIVKENAQVSVKK